MLLLCKKYGSFLRKYYKYCKPKENKIFFNASFFDQKNRKKMKITWHDIELFAAAAAPAWENSLLARCNCDNQYILLSEVPADKVCSPMRVLKWKTKFNFSNQDCTLIFTIISFEFVSRSMISITWLQNYRILLIIKLSWWKILWRLRTYV